MRGKNRQIPNGICLALTDVLWCVGLCAYADPYDQRPAVLSSVIFHFSTISLIFFTRLTVSSVTES